MSQYSQPGHHQHAPGHPYGGQPAAEDEFIVPDADLMRRQMEEANQQGRAKSGVPQPKFIKHPTPPNCDSWRQAPVGSKVQIFLWLCPAYARGKTLGHTLVSHFGYPRGFRNGRRIICAGDDCALCVLWHDLRRNTPDHLKKAVHQLKQRREYLYNAIHLTRGHDGDHTVKDGGGAEYRRAAIVSFGAEANRALLEILEMHGVGNVCHPHHGTVLAYTRTRVNAEETGFRYTLMPVKQQPLPANWIDLCRPSGMWNLEEINPPASREDQIGFLKGLGLTPPMMDGQVLPAPGQAAQVTSSWDAPPSFGDDFGSPPASSPPLPQPQQAPATQQTYYDPTQAYDGGQSDHPYGAPATPQGQHTATGFNAPQARPMPPVDAEYGMDEPPQWDAASEFGEPPPPKYPEPARGTITGRVASSDQTPARQPQQMPPPAPGAYQAPQQVAPQAAPAPDYNAVPPAAPSYGAATPQSSQQGPPAAPNRYAPVAQGARQDGPPPAPAASGSRRLVAPLAAGIRLPGDRERCFTRYDPAATMCGQCMPWIKSQCMPQTPGFVPPQAVGDAQLEQMAQKMRQD